MDGGSKQESAAAPNGLTHAAASRKKSLIEFWTVRMQYPSMGLAYHHRWRLLSVGRVGPQSGCRVKISAPVFGSTEQISRGAWRFHPPCASRPPFPRYLFNHLRRRTNS